MSGAERSFGALELGLYIAGVFIGALALEHFTRREPLAGAIPEIPEKTLELRRRAADAIDAELVGEAGGEGA